jgi:hypothetical protein
MRLAIFALCLGLAAACSEAPDPAVGLLVRADDGTVLGRVAAIERDRDGRIVAAEIEGLEPADAPDPSTENLAQDQERLWVRTSASTAPGSPALSALR